MKRQGSTASSIGAKKGKSERAEAFNKLRDVSDKLDEMESKCAEEQIEVQRKWDKKKQLFFDERREIIKQIPKFWWEAIRGHPCVSLLSLDYECLQFLDDVDVEDNLDNNGSYRATLRWRDGNPFFPEKVLVKSVTFHSGDAETVECTPITWAPGKNIPHIAQELAKKEADKSKHTSFFQWFSSSTASENDFGEVLRKDIWLVPMQYMGEEAAADEIWEVNADDDA